MQTGHSKLENSPTRVIITGTGRSGSGYISKVLTEAGLPCGHERLVSLDIKPYRAKLIDSSWLALPVLEMYGFSGPVFHQVRNPLSVLSSLMNGRLVSSPAVNKHKKYRLRYTPVPAPSDNNEDNWFAFFVLYLADWIQRCDIVAEHTWRLEDVDADTILTVASAAGKQVSRNKAEAAIANVSKTTNKHPDGPEITWEQVLDVDGGYKLYEIGKYYNYV